MTFTRPWTSATRQREVAALCEDLVPVFRKRGADETASYLRERAALLGNEPTDDAARRAFVQLFELASAGRGGPSDEPVMNDDRSIDWEASAAMVRAMDSLGEATASTYRRSRSSRWVDQKGSGSPPRRRCRRC
jgi:hypothetical protein